MTAVLSDWRSVGMVVGGIVTLVVALTALLILRKALATILGELRRMKVAGTEFNFQDSLDEARQGVASGRRPVPTTKGQFSEVYGHFAERLNRARGKTKEVPVRAMEEAGGALREFLEAATAVAGIDMSLNSSRLVALARHGLPFSVVQATLALTTLEIRTLSQEGPALTATEADDYIGVTQDVAGQVLAYLEHT